MPGSPSLDSDPLLFFLSSIILDSILCTVDLFLCLLSLPLFSRLTPLCVVSALLECSPSCVVMLLLLVAVLCCTAAAMFVYFLPIDPPNTSSHINQFIALESTCVITVS